MSRDEILSYFWHSDISITGFVCTYVYLFVLFRFHGAFIFFPVLKFLVGTPRSSFRYNRLSNRRVPVSLLCTRS